MTNKLEYPIHHLFIYCIFRTCSEQVGAFDLLISRLSNLVFDPPTSGIRDGGTRCPEMRDEARLRLRDLRNRHHRL